MKAEWRRDQIHLQESVSSGYFLILWFVELGMFRFLKSLKDASIFFFLLMYEVTNIWLLSVV